MIKFLTLIVAFTTIQVSIAGKVDTTFVERYPKSLTVKPFIDYKYNKLFLHDDATNSDIIYNSFQSPLIGIGGAYKWFNFLAGITPLYQPNSQLNNTKQTDIQWNIYLKAISSDIRYQKFEGFYLNNSNDISNAKELPHQKYIRPDLHVTSIGINLRYNFNSDKYSQKSVFSQTERQLKSAGSPTMGVRWNYLGIAGDSSFIPSLITPPFVNFTINNAEIYDQGIGAGYSYSFVKYNWFCNLTVMPWILYQVFKFNDLQANKTTKLTSFQYIVQTRGAIGYHGEKDYCGLVFVSDQMRSRWRNAHDVNYNFGNIKLFYARRFNL